jgi:hypothetical protein
MRKRVIPFLFLTAVIALASSVGFFQALITDAQKQADALQTQLEYYENSTSVLQVQVNNLEAQVNDLQHPVFNVTIESVTSEPWFVPVGMALFKELYITIKNIGVNDVGGLTFEFKILTNGTVWESEYYEIALAAPDQLGVLHVQESTIIRAEIQSSIGAGLETADKTFVVAVMLDNNVLDERTETLSKAVPGGA